MNVLKHAGILAGAPRRRRPAGSICPRADCFAFAEDDGLVEPSRCDLGDAGRGPATSSPASIRIGRTGLAPANIAPRMDGMLAARHFPGLIKAGDCLAVIATDGDGPEPSPDVERSRGRTGAEEPA